MKMIRIAYRIHVTVENSNVLVPSMFLAPCGREKVRVSVSRGVVIFITIEGGER